MTTPIHPLISCLCVTRRRVQKLRRAVDCFLAQRHPNKELVLVYEDDDEPTREFAQALAREHPALIRDVEVPAVPKRTLGELRNLAVRQSRGDYFCQWDDDDWHHEERIGRQLKCAQTNQRDACFLINWIIFDETERRAYLSRTRMWEGSILCKRALVSESFCYPALTRGEDTEFTKMLVTRGCVYPLVAPDLYIYTVHSSNTWPRAHFEAMFAHARPLPEESRALIEDILAGKSSVGEASLELSRANLAAPSTRGLVGK